MASLALSLKENQWELWQHHCQNSATMEGRSQQKLQFMILKKNLLESRIMSIIIKVTDLSRKVDNLSKVVSDKKDYRVCTKSGKPGK